MNKRKDQQQAKKKPWLTEGPKTIQATGAGIFSEKCSWAEQQHPKKNWKLLENIDY